MLDPLFFAFWIFGLVAILLVAKASGFDLLHVTVLQFFLIKSVVVSYFGYPLLYFHVYDYRVSSGIVDQGLISTASIAAFISIITPILIVWLFKSVSGQWRRKEVNARNESEVYVSNNTSIVYWVFLLFVSVLVTALYLKQVPAIALFESFRGGDVALVRSQMTNDFAGRYHWYSIFFDNMMRLVALVLFAVALVKNRIFLWVVSGLALILTLFTLSMTGQKAPVAWFLASIFFVYFLVCRGGRIGVRGIVITAVFVFTPLVFGYLIFMGAGGVSESLYLISSRAFTGQISGAYNYQWIFPEHVDYLKGASFPNPRGVFPFEHYRLTVEVMNIVNPSLVDRGVVGSQPTMYWGEGYANFGWLGVPLSAFFVGLVFVTTILFLQRIKSFEVKMAATVWLGYELSRFASSGFAWALLPTTIFIGVSVVILHELLVRKVEISSHRPQPRKP